jgi:hypothetical protein
MQFGPGFLPTFLYYFTGATIIFTLLAVKGLGLSLETGIPAQLGVVSGLIVGGVGTYLNQTTTFSIQFRDRKKFLKELKTSLNELGYEPTSEVDGIQIYERSSVRKLLSGRIYIQLEGNQATIAGRAASMRRLQKALG